MSRKVRIAAATLALALLAACAQAKDTGLPSGPTKEAKPLTTVDVIDSAFKPATLNVKAGEQVTFEFIGAAPHNARFTTVKVDSHPSCVPAGSGCSSAGADPFKTTFDKPGTYPYYCVVHGTPAGQGMAGKIVVA